MSQRPPRRSAARPPVRGGRRPQPGSGSRPAPRARAAARSPAYERALVVLAALAAWSIVPPYLGPPLGLELAVSSTTEVVDHVLPGAVAIAGALLARAYARRGEPEAMGAMAGLAACVLAGLFQTVSHLPLVLDAGGPLQPVGAVALHSTPGPALLALSLWLLLRPPPEGARA